MANLIMAEPEAAERQRKMFGMTKAEMLSQMIFTDKDDAHAVLIYAMGILSDVQEVLEGIDEQEVDTHRKETARQWINKAKFFMAAVATALREPPPLKPKFE